MLYVQAAAGVVADSVAGAGVEAETEAEGTGPAARSPNWSRRDWNERRRETRLLMIDNYDSFTYNIVQYFGELGADVEVYRNDEITLEDIAARRPDRLVVSPGPCSPAEAGISVAAIRHFMGRLPVLGVCLGHQSIGAALGGRIVRAKELMHGKTSRITTTQTACSRPCRRTSPWCATTRC